MRPDPIEKTAAMLVRGIARRSRTVGTLSAHLSLVSPDIAQRVVERLARRRRWAELIRAQEPADR